MSVATHGVVPGPLRFLCVVDLDLGHCLIWVIGPASHDHHAAANEAAKVLVAANRSIGLGLRRGHPIPTPVSMLSQSPHIIQGCNLKLFH